MNTFRLRSRSATALAGVVALSVVATTGLGAGAQDQRPIFRGGVDLTRIKVAVLDEAGQPVPGLTADDFRAFEDGHEQPVEVVLAPDDAPLDVALVLDFSISVEQEWADPKPRLAIHALLDSLAPDDCVYLLPFHYRTGPGTWGRPNDRELRRIVDRFPYEAETRLYDAIRAAYRALETRRLGPVEPRDPERGAWSGLRPLAGDEPSPCALPLDAAESVRRRAAMVVLTDGEDTTSRTEYADILLMAHRSDVPVFAVAVGMAGSRPRSSRYLRFSDFQRNRDYSDNLQARLMEMARVSGGHLVTERDIRDGYDEVLALLRGYYVVAYRTPRPIREGWRQVAVDITEGEHQRVLQPGVFRTATDYEALQSTLQEADRNLERGDLAAALSLYRLAASLAPEDAQPHYGRGLAMQRLELWPGARDAFSRALEMEPGAPEIHARLAEVSERLGDDDVAWVSSIRAHRGGVSMNAVFTQLRDTGGPPAAGEALMVGPAIEINKASVPDLEATFLLEDVRRRIVRLFEADGRTIVARRPRRVDFIGWFDLEELGVAPDGEMDLRFRVLDLRRGDEHNQRIRVAAIGDAPAMQVEIERAIAEATEWIHRQYDGD